MNSLEKRAYHEAGHVVAAYLVGYSCKKLEITGKNPLDNNESYDFREDAELIYTIYKYKEYPDRYDDLSQSAKNNCRNVASRAIIVLMGGPASESVSKNGGTVVANPVFTISVHDFEAADTIDYFLSIVKQGQHPTNYLQEVYRQVLKLMGEKEVWNAVTTLANTVVKSGDKKLERKEVEKILLETGFLSYISNLKQNRGSVRSSSSAASTATGFTKEELEKLKKECKKGPPVNKKDGVIKVINFVKGMKYSNFQIGLTDDPEGDLFFSGKIDKNDKDSYIIIETLSHSVARDVLMYFICLGMEVVPGSSKSKEASTVYVLQKQ